MSGEYAYLISAVYSVRTQEIETLLKKNIACVSSESTSIAVLEIVLTCVRWKLS